MVRASRPAEKGHPLDTQDQGKSVRAAPSAICITYLCQESINRDTLARRCNEINGEKKGELEKWNDTIEYQAGLINVNEMHVSFIFNTSLNERKKKRNENTSIELSEYSFVQANLFRTKLRRELIKLRVRKRVGVWRVGKYWRQFGWTRSRKRATANSRYACWNIELITRIGSNVSARRVVKSGAEQNPGRDRERWNFHSRLTSPSEFAEGFAVVHQPRCRCSSYATARKTSRVIELS